MCLDKTDPLTITTNQIFVSCDITLFFGEYEKDLEEIRKHAFDNGDKTTVFVIESLGN